MTLPWDGLPCYVCVVGRMRLDFAALLMRCTCGHQEHIPDEQGSVIP